MIELRKGGWNPRRAIEEPKKIADIHKEARDIELQRSSDHFHHAKSSSSSIEDMIEEYTMNRDPDEIISFFKKLTAQYRSSSIVQLIYWSLEKSAEDRNLLSSLFDTLVARFVLNQNNFIDAYVPHPFLFLFFILFYFLLNLLITFRFNLSF